MPLLHAKMYIVYVSYINLAYYKYILFFVYSFAFMLWTLREEKKMKNCDFHLYKCNCESLLNKHIGISVKDKDFLLFVLFACYHTLLYNFLYFYKNMKQCNKIKLSKNNRNQKINSDFDYCIVRPAPKCIFTS